MHDPMTNFLLAQGSKSAISTLKKGKYKYRLIGNQKNKLAYRKIDRQIVKKFYKIMQQF